MTEAAQSKHIIIVGAGPGGLTSAMMLAHRGFKVTVFEKNSRVGGRNAAIEKDGYKYDTGPTFLMLKDILDEVFSEAGANSSDYLKFQQLEPMYRLQFDDMIIEPTTDKEQMKAQIAKHFPGQEKGLAKYYQNEAKRFQMLYPCLQKDYSSASKMLSMDLANAAPYLAAGRSLINVLGDYFKPEKLRIAFTFQAKYLGMSPWECPGLFAILAYIEHGYGVFHTEGGLSNISEAMQKVAESKGALIKLNTPAKSLIVEKKKVLGVELDNGEKVLGDEVIINADFAHAMTNLVPEGLLKKWTKPKIDKKKFSCSTFMLYLGLDKVYDMPHHTIVFAEDYRQNLKDIFNIKQLSDDISIYIRNSSINDPTVAPPGHSAVYILVPTPNQFSGIDWTKQKNAFRELVLKTIAEKTSMKDIEKHIKSETMITPLDWEENQNVYKGATFNLGHNLMQLLYLRPRNRFEELDHCWLVGGGTHPGSGLPTIYESGRITSNLISKKYQVPFVSNNLKA